MPAIRGTRRTLLGVKRLGVLDVLHRTPDYLLAFPHQLPTGAVSETDNIAVALGRELYSTPNAASDPAGNEADATTGWSAASSTLTSDSSIKNVGDYSLKHVSTGVAGRIRTDLNTILTVGKRYRLSFDTRHTGSGGVQRVNLAVSDSGSTNILIQLTNTDTTFQNIIYEFVHSSDTRWFLAREFNEDNDGGVYIDNISLKQTNILASTAYPTPGDNPLDGVDTGTTPGVPMGRNLSKTDDGATSKTVLGLTEYNSMINPVLFHIGIGIQKAVWDASERYFVSHIIDADNWIKIGGTATAGQLVYEIRAGGTTEQILHASGSPTGIIMPSISSRSGVMKAWLGSTQVGGNVNIANTLIGNFVTMILGAEDATPTNVNLANRNFNFHFSDEKTSAELAPIARAIGASQ